MAAIGVGVVSTVLPGPVGRVESVAVAAAAGTGSAVVVVGSRAAAPAMAPA